MRCSVSVSLASVNPTTERNCKTVALAVRASRVHMLQGGMQRERRASWAAIEPQVAREHNLRVEWIKVLHAGRHGQVAIPWQVPLCTSRQHKSTSYPACYSTQQQP
jgi:hypothetical protein